MGSGLGVLLVSRRTGSGVVLPHSICALLFALMESLHPEAWEAPSQGLLMECRYWRWTERDLEVQVWYAVSAPAFSTRPERVCPGVCTNPTCILFSSSWPVLSKAHPDVTLGCSCALQWTRQPLWGQARASSPKIIVGSFASDGDGVMDASGRWRNSSDAHSALMRALSERRWYP